MRKVLKRISICLLLTVVIWICAAVADRGQLREELIRLHVVGASDSEEDQRLKLRVRDAVRECLEDGMESLSGTEEALAYLEENLPKIEAAANRVLREAGCDDTATAHLGTEEFSKRVYDTFSLPAGVYQSLRIVIGEGAGRNWWCVVYPSLCTPVTEDGFEEAARCAGFSDTLTMALEGKEGYEIRFFLMDLVGRLENLFRR